MNQEKMAVTCEVALINSQNLSKGEVELLGKAHEAAANAYAPYSGFHVGAAVRLKSGTVVLGNNQENIAYPSGLCGERVAVFAAGAQFPEEEIESIAIVSPSPLAVPDALPRHLVSCHIDDDDLLNVDGRSGREGSCRVAGGRVEILQMVEIR